jgi:hypothetical protein
MEHNMLYVKSRKTFKVKLKFVRHIHSKPNHILLNSMKLLRRCLCL